MSKRARLQDGTVFTFPDDTPQEVMDQTVAAHIAQSQQKPTAGQQVVGGAKKVAGGVLGFLDVMGAGTRGTINTSAQTLSGMAGGLVGAIDPSITARQGYADWKAAEAARQQQMTASGTALLPNVGMVTPQGEAVGQAISNIPAPGGIPNEGDTTGRGRMGPTVNALGETIGGAIETHLGPEFRDIARDAFALLSMKGGGARPSGASAQAINRAARAGYVVPPTAVVGNADPGLLERARGAITGKPTITEPVYAGSATDRIARSIGGASDVDARIAMRNQQVTQQMAAEAARLPEMSPQAYARSVAEQNGRYDALKNFKDQNGRPLYVPLNSPSYATRVLNLEKIPGWDPMVVAPSAVDGLKNEMLSVHPNVEGLVNKVRQLRDDAFANFDGDSGQQMLGRAQREAADILEDELQSHLQFIAQRSNDPNFRAIATRVFDDYVAACQQLSILHDIKYGMNPATGTIDASRIARLNMERPNKLAPGLQEIANAHNAFGGTGMTVAEKATRTAGNPLGNAMDIGGGMMAGAYSGGMTGSAQNAIMGGAIGALAIPFMRYAARETALRGPASRALTGGVNNFVLRPGVTAAAISQQLPEERQ